MKKPACAICNEVNEDNSYGWVDDLGLVHKICYHATQPRNFVKDESSKEISDGNNVAVGVDVQKVGSKAK